MATWETFDGHKIAGPFDERDLLEAFARGLDPALVVRPVGADEWKALSAYPHLALAAERARARDAARPQPRPWKRWTPIGAGTVVLVLLIANTLWIGLGGRVEAACNTTGAGDATCSFSNRGFLPASGCWSIVVRRSGIIRGYPDYEGLRSVPMCSGVVWPGSSTSSGSRLAFIAQSPGTYCTSDGGSWPHSCTVSAEPTR